MLVEEQREHPQPGPSKAVHYPAQLKREIAEQVLPIVQKLLKDPAEIGVFTESELKLNPNLLTEFITFEDSQ